MGSAHPKGFFSKKGLSIDALKKCPTIPYTFLSLWRSNVPIARNGLKVKSLFPIGYDMSRYLAGRWILTKKSVFNRVSEDRTITLVNFDFY